MRVTRAAQRAQQDVEAEHIEEPEVNERALKDIEPNTSLATLVEEPLPAKTPAKTPAKKGKGKGKKGAKSKKATTEEEEVAQLVEEAERQADVGTVNEAAKPESTKELPDGSAQISSEEELSKVPQTPAPRLTRRQLAKLEEEEALSKLQVAPSAQPTEDKASDVTEEAVEQNEAATETDVDATTEKDEQLPTHEGTIEAEPDTTSMPARQTRLQQTKRERQQPGELVAGYTTEDVPEQPEAPVEVAELTENEPPAAVEHEPELATKSARLTRRQQAKLEEEQKQTQIQQHATQPEPTEEQALEEVVAEAQAEVGAAVEQEEAVHEEINKIIDRVTVVAKEASSSRVKAESTNQHEKSGQVEAEIREKEALVEAQPVESQSSQTALAEDVSGDMVEARPPTLTEEEFEANFTVQVDTAVPEETMSSVEVEPEAEPKMLHAEKPFEGPDSTPTRHQRSIRRTSRSPSKSPMRLEESISAIDRLEEDLESIGKAIPDVNHSDDERSSREPKSIEVSAASTARGKTSSKTPAKVAVKTSTRTPAVLGTKSIGTIAAKASVPARATAGVRASIAPKAPALAKAVAPTRISRAPSAAPKSVKPTTTSLARASSVRAAPIKDVRKPSTETADYLASKRRPISLSFPTPPPPPKGRAPTKSTFQLSSDSVAAKLKAQREERVKREAEGSTAPKQRPISMPPPPKSSKPPTVPSFQLPGEATAARLKTLKEERQKRMEEAGGAGKLKSQSISMPPPPKSTKQLTKPSFQLPGEATAARLKAQKEERLKRMEEAEAVKKAAAAAPVRRAIAHRPRESLLVRDTPGMSIPPPPQSDAPPRSTSLASKRSSIVGVSGSRSTSTSSANRNSILLAEGGKSTVTPVDAAALKVKGKQVFNRDKLEKEALERERRDKEEAAKKARAEAAERGRIASREWAERQRKKTMMTGQ